MIEDKANLMNILTDVELLIRKGKLKLALQRLSDLRKALDE